jgi:hypothetical protein
MTPGHPLGGIGLPSTRAASSICIKKLLLPTNCKQAYLECACTFTHSGRGANLPPLTKFVSTRPNSLHLSRHPHLRTVIFARGAVGKQIGGNLKQTIRIKRRSQRLRLDGRRELIVDHGLHLFLPFLKLTLHRFETPSDRALVFFLCFDLIVRYR